jgi:FAD/FMN-containing dehydrogenase
VRRDELRNSIDAEGWSRWTRTFLALLDEGPTVATSPEDSTIKRLRLAEIAVRARRLLDEAGLQPTLPGAYGHRPTQMLLRLAMRLSGSPDLRRCWRRDRRVCRELVLSPGRSHCRVSNPINQPTQEFLDE